MRTLRALTLALLLPANAIAGSLDGVWRIDGDSPDMLDLLYEANGFLFFIELSNLPTGQLEGEWSDTAYGPINGNVASLTVYSTRKTESTTITFSSATEGTVVINSCKPKVAATTCPPINTPMIIRKVL